LAAAILVSLAVAWVPTGTTAFADAPFELTARRLEIDLERRTLSAEGDVGIVWAQHPGAPGPRLFAERLTWDGQSLFVDRATFTTCSDCRGRPDWVVRARSAVVDPGRGVSARAPVLVAGGVPIFALPSAWLPLGPRRTGLLAPRPGWTVPFGFEWRQPFFWAPDRWWDLTVAPHIASRRGPGGTLEVRATPAPNVDLRLEPHGLLDYGEPRARGFAWARPEPIPRWGLDGSAHAAGSRLRLEADLGLRGDSAWVAERAETFDRRNDEYARSRLILGPPSRRWVLGAHWLQDLRASTHAPAGDDLRSVSMFSTEAPGPGAVRYRLLEARWDVPSLAVPRLPLLVDVQARLHGASALGDGRGRFLRTDVRPELRWPWGRFVPGLGLVQSELWLAGRATGWLGPDPGSEPGGRLAPLGGGRVGVELEHGWGRLRHVMRPAIEAVVVPEVFESIPDRRLLVGDEVDLLGPVAQVGFRLDSSWYDVERGERTGGILVATGHDFGIGGREGRGTIEVRGSADHRWSTADDRVAIESRVTAIWSFASSSLRRFTASTSARHRAGHAVRLGYARTAERPPESSFIAPEEVVPSATLGPDGLVALPGFLARDAAERAGLRPVSPGDVATVAMTLQVLDVVSWDVAVDLALEDLEAARVVYGADATIVQSLRTSVALEGRCRCWSAAVEAGTARDRAGWDARGFIELRGLGSGGRESGPPPE